MCKLAILRLKSLWSNTSSFLLLVVGACNGSGSLSSLYKDPSARCSQPVSIYSLFFLITSNTQFVHTALNLHQPLAIMHCLTLFLLTLASFLLPIAAGPLVARNATPTRNVCAPARTLCSADLLPRDFSLAPRLGEATLTWKSGAPPRQFNARIISAWARCRQAVFMTEIGRDVIAVVPHSRGVPRTPFALIPTVKEPTVLLQRGQSVRIQPIKVASVARGAHRDKFAPKPSFALMRTVRDPPKTKL